MRGWEELRGLDFQSSLSPQAMGRGTTRRVVEGRSAAWRSPSTMLRMVPLPMRFAHGEDEYEPAAFAATKA